MIYRACVLKTCIKLIKNTAWLQGVYLRPVFGGVIS